MLQAQRVSGPGINRLLRGECTSRAGWLVHGGHNQKFMRNERHVGARMITSRIAMAVCLWTTSLVLSADRQLESTRTRRVPVVERSCFTC